MNRRFFRDLVTRRSSAWTFGLCLTGVLVIGTIVALDSARTEDPKQPETMEQAYLDEDYQESGESAGQAGSVGDMVLADAGGADAGETLNEEAEDTVNVSSGNAEEDTGETYTDDSLDETAQEAAAGENAPEAEQAGDEEAAEEAASTNVISEEALLEAGASFQETDTLLWPAAGTILIDYSMDGSVYFPTLDQYKYNPALIIGSSVGNQVVCAAKGIVESVDTNEVNGLTMTVNIGNGYRLVYGQLKEVSAAPGDVVEAGSVIGYVSEPTRFYTKEGSSLYFQMTKDQVPVDPILYLE